MNVLNNIDGANQKGRVGILERALDRALHMSGFETCLIQEPNPVLYFGDGFILILELILRLNKRSYIKFLLHSWPLEEAQKLAPFMLRLLNIEWQCFIQRNVPFNDGTSGIMEVSSPLKKI